MGGWIGGWLGGWVGGWLGGWLRGWLGACTSILISTNLPLKKRKKLFPLMHSYHSN